MLVPKLRLGAVHRAERVLVAAGGKGLNVARAARALGQPVAVCAPLGGLTGELVARLAADEGFVGRWSRHCAGETRTCVLLVDPHGGDATALNEVGPTLDAADWQEFAATVVAAAATADLTTISGSLPPGVPSNALADLNRTLHAGGRRALVDTSGEALRAVLAAAPYGVKVNAAELSAGMGRQVTDVDTAAAALADLRASGIVLAAVSMGAQGALAADATGIYWACPPALTIVSSIGCGDSLLAGLATGLLRGEDLGAALRLGVACGSADALTIGGGLLHLDDVERIGAATSVTLLSH